MADRPYAPYAPVLACPAVFARVFAVAALCALCGCEVETTAPPDGEAPVEGVIIDEPGFAVSPEPRAPAAPPPPAVPPEPTAPEPAAPPDGPLALPLDRSWDGPGPFLYQSAPLDPRVRYSSGVAVRTDLATGTTRTFLDALYAERYGREDLVGGGEDLTQNRWDDNAVPSDGVYTLTRFGFLGAPRIARYGPQGDRPFRFDLRDADVPNADYAEITSLVDDEAGGRLYAVVDEEDLPTDSTLQPTPHGRVVVLDRRTGAHRATFRSHDRGEGTAWVARLADGGRRLIVPITGVPGSVVVGAFRVLDTSSGRRLATTTCAGATTDTTRTLLDVEAGRALFVHRPPHPAPDAYEVCDVLNDRVVARLTAPVAVDDALPGTSAFVHERAASLSLDGQRVVVRLGDVRRRATSQSYVYDGQTLVYDASTGALRAWHQAPPSRWPLLFYDAPDRLFWVLYHDPGYADDPPTALSAPALVTRLDHATPPVDLLDALAEYLWTGYDTGATAEAVRVVNRARTAIRAGDRATARSLLRWAADALVRAGRPDKEALVRSVSERLPAEE